MNNPNLNLAMPQGLSRVRIAVGVVVAFLFLSHLEDLAGGLLTAAAALAYARLRRWPEVKFRYYFSTLKLALPGCAFVAGASAQVALLSLDQPGLGMA